MTPGRLVGSAERDSGSEVEMVTYDRSVSGANDAFSLELIGIAVLPGGILLASAFGNSVAAGGVENAVVLALAFILPPVLFAWARRKRGREQPSYELAAVLIRQKAVASASAILTILSMIAAIFWSAVPAVIMISLQIATAIVVFTLRRRRLFSWKARSGEEAGSRVFSANIPAQSVVRERKN